MNMNWMICISNNNSVYSLPFSCPSNAKSEISARNFCPFASNSLLKVFLKILVFKQLPARRFLRTIALLVVFIILILIENRKSRKKVPIDSGEICSENCFEKSSYSKNRFSPNFRIPTRYSPYSSLTKSQISIDSFQQLPVPEASFPLKQHRATFCCCSVFLGKVASVGKIFLQVCCLLDIFWNIQQQEVTKVSSMLSQRRRSLSSYSVEFLTKIPATFRQLREN